MCMTFQVRTCVPCVQVATSLFDTVNCKCKALTLSIKALRSDFYSNVSFLLTAASDRTKYSLQRAKLSFGTVKSIRYSGVRFHIFYCNSAGLSDVFSL